MTPLEQIKQRIENMRKTNPDSNGLCYLLDFVDRLVTEEKAQADKPTICHICDNSNGASDEHCALYIHDENGEVCLLKSGLSNTRLAYLEKLDKGAE